jgi:four helix bundle protein
MVGGVSMSSSFKDLRVWQEALRFVVEIYRTTARFPRHELYGLSQQLRRAAVSIPSNIAEGKGHRSDREFGHFLFHARGSLLEVQTQIMIAQELQYLRVEEGRALLASADAIGRSLNSLINSLRERVA